MFELYVRHFGGIKLGTGGLVRAYGGVASECLRNAPSCVVKSKVILCFPKAVCLSFFFSKCQIDDSFIFKLS